MTAGSKPSFLANIGKVQPINLARTTVAIKVKQTHKATLTFTASTTKSLTKSL